jgi:hypothetical protein
MSANYTPSVSLDGEFVDVRERAFTRWMSRDLMQASIGFCKNIGLTSIYAEVSPEGATRHLFWHPPVGAAFEVRSGRSFEQFTAFDTANASRGMALLSLHLNPNAVYSAVWISSDHLDAGKSTLERFGIKPAERKPASDS